MIDALAAARDAWAKNKTPANARAYIAAEEARPDADRYEAGREALQMAVLYLTECDEGLH